MIKLIIVSALLLSSFNSIAQVQSRIFTCVDRSKDNFKFDVKFDGQTARVWVQDVVYNLKYERLLNRQDGKLFRVYGNQEFTATTSYPNDNFVFLQTNERSPRSIAAAHCQ
jgi:hypothetical protein